MNLERAHQIVDALAKLIELAGVGIILAGVVLATAMFVRQGLGANGWRGAYERYRSNLGRGILLGLELLVGADIISTITAPLSFQSVGLLAGIIAIRTFLSFSLETEIEGCWPLGKGRARPRRGWARDYRCRALIASPAPISAVPPASRGLCDRPASRRRAARRGRRSGSSGSWCRPARGPTCRCGRPTAKPGPSYRGSPAREP